VPERGSQVTDGKIGAILCKAAMSQRYVDHRRGPDLAAHISRSALVVLN
jgi:hypothetical protein